MKTHTLTITLNIYKELQSSSGTIKAFRATCLSWTAHLSNGYDSVSNIS
jgi:hypothetical protein